MKKSQKGLCALAAVLFSGLVLFSVWQAERNAQLEELVTEGRHRIAALQAQRATAPERTAGRDLLSPPERRALRAAGLDNPAEALRADLASRPDLIPVEPSLGGAMGFYDPGQIHILSDRWVVAGFEDGHTAGKLLLRYRIERGTIQWDVLGVRRF